MIVDDFEKSPSLETLSNSTSESRPNLNVESDPSISDGLPAYSASSSLAFSAARSDNFEDLFEELTQDDLTPWETEPINFATTKVLASLKEATTTLPKLTVHISGYNTQMILAKGKMEAMHKQEFGFWIDLSAEVRCGIGKDGTMGGYLYSEGGYLGGLPHLNGASRASYSDRKMSKKMKEKGYPGFLKAFQEFPSTDSFHAGLLFRTHFLDLLDIHAQNSLQYSPLDNSNEFIANQIQSQQSKVPQLIQTYCTSDNALKKIMVTSEVYGWNWSALERRLKETARAAGYTGDIRINFKTGEKNIIIRPECIVTRILKLSTGLKVLWWLSFTLYILLYSMNTCVKIVMGSQYNLISLFSFKHIWIVTFLCLSYPLLSILDKLVLPYRLFISHPLTRWKLLPIPATASSSTSGLNRDTILSKAEAIEIARPLSLRLTPKVAQLPALDSLKEGTWVYLVGNQEGEWLKTWEEKIVDGVKRGRKGQLGASKKEEVTESVADDADALRGYENED